MKNFRSFNLRFAAMVAAVLFFVSCKKDDDTAPDPDATGTLILEFEHKFGDNALQFGTNYTNAAGETMTFDLFKYFISNVELVREDNSVYAVPREKSYFLIDHSNINTLEARIPDVPVGSYKAVRFIIGVDSLTNSKEADLRTGVLDVSGAAQGMYWSWNSGYIFVKVEGTSPQSTNENKRFRYHIGGFGGYSSPTINNIKTTEVSREGGAPIPIQKDRNRVAHIMVDLAVMFNQPNVIAVAESSTTMFNAFSVRVADNYANMFKLDHIH